MVIPPEGPVPRHLAVDAQAEEDGGGDGHGPYRPQEHRGVVGHHTGGCCFGGVAAGGEESCMGCASGDCDAG